MKPSSSIFLLIKCSFFLLIFASCAGKYSMPEKTLRTMVQAAKENDIGGFTECLDLESVRQMALASMPPGMQVPDKILDSLVRHSVQISPNFALLMDVYRNRQVTLLSDTELGKDTRELAIKIAPNQGTDALKEDTTNLVFVRRNHFWKLNLEKTSEAMHKR